jgi:excisionase family DNA binding protein
VNHLNLLDRVEAAKYLGVSPGTMCVWVSRKQYDLPYIKVGKYVKYKVEDLNKFIETRTMRFDKTKD